MELLLQGITSKSNPKIVRTAKYADKKYRDQDRVFICEGIKLLEEVILAGARIREIYLEESAVARWSDRLTELISQLPSVECFSVSKELYSKISTESAPQGILAVVEKTYNVIRSSQVEVASEETVMLFESVRDPGNMGTLIRTAAAFGFDRLILSADCADVFNPKVLRGAMGAIFKVRIDYCDSFVQEVEYLNRCGRRTLAALPKEQAMVAGRSHLSSSDCVVIGNEGHGLSEDVIRASSGAIYIPMKENTESLNAAIASSVLMWEIAKSKQN